MQGANLYVYSSKAEVQTFVSEIKSNKKNHLLEISLQDKKESVGIEQIRELIKFLSTPPGRKHLKIGLIYDGAKMTVQAQNALLKTLEDLPSYAGIAIFAKREGDLLETVISRCKKFNISKSIGTSDKTNQYVEFMGLTLGEKLDWAEEKAKLDSSGIVELLDQMVRGLHQEIIKNPGHAHISNADTLCSIRDDIEKFNVNKRLALEQIVMFLEQGT